MPPSPQDPTVRSLEVSAYTVPTDQPEADGTITWDSTSLVVVEPTAEGVTGLGWSYTSPHAVGLVRDVLAQCVVGADALDVRGHQETMRRRVRNIGYRGLAANAISAVDIALWDLKAKLLGQPLAKVLGRWTPTLPIYGSGGFTTYDAQRTSEQLGRWVHELGIPRVKIKIGESWGSDEQRDLDRIGLARSVIGPDTELFVDANGGYGAGQAVRMAHAMESERVTWFEEPVSSDDERGLALVRGQVLPDVAAGEYVFDEIDALRLCRAGAVDCLQLDVTRCGGVTGWLQAAAVAAAHCVPLSAHCAPNLHAAFVGAVPKVRHLEYFHDHARIEDMLFDGALDPAGGSLTPSTERPGLGLELRRSDAE
ncbi:MAG: enolase C-terminal domain-like protein, partial [Actinomycetes bacterium]